ncbi:putative capsular polysaccharide biosynthesis protein YwqC [Rubrobacter xylanophilus DSM 9941]|uniref:YveK family protein n=1 Tax=Rubrobacter xylanophilus TaxID=49319 RepID=UPI001C63EEDD|nr:Wzz/FepE/Etk N-terminal domain-containing protein [Rubrobacter xylanophilus]QYJ15080.1 putative capsular polysaccharide biosynthesis protein YwqC [Rubrobacter xylanophilus DSM 9941]
MNKDTTIPREPASQKNREAFFSPKDFLRVLRRRAWAVFLGAFVLAASAVGFSLLQTPLYEASITILVGQKSGEDGPRNLSGDVEGLQQLTQTVAEAVATRPIAEAAAGKLGLPEDYSQSLLGNLKVEQRPGTMFVEVRYRDPDPRRAQRVANAVGEVFSERVSEVSPGASAITATVWEEAVVPETPVSPDPLLNGLVALALGLLLGVGLAFLLEYLDDSWESPEEVERVSGVPTFGVIPGFRMEAGGKKGGR